VAVHHLPGWDEFYREFSERLARHGFTVICPDLCCRFGHVPAGSGNGRLGEGLQLPRPPAGKLSAAAGSRGDTHQLRGDSPGALAGPVLP